ncbi:MAG: YybS family protein [Firmicutes bacterium]|nr:YybS family protein [Bacillota bacterium]
MPPTRTRPLVEAVLLAVLSLLLVLAGSWLPLLGLVALLLSPLPTLVATVRLGPRLGLASATVAALASFLFAGPLGALATWLDLAAFGASMGWAWRSRRDAFWVIGAGALGMVATILVTLAVGRLLLGQDLLAQLRDQMLQSTRQAGSLLSAAGGVDARQAENASRQLSSQIELLFGQLLPTVVLAAGTGYALLLLLVAGPMAGRLGLPRVELPPFARWELPSWSVGFLLVGLVLAWAGRGSQSFPAVAGANLLLLAELLFLVGGLSFSYFWLRRWRLPRGLGAFVLALAVLNPYLSQALVWLGLFDSVVHLRRRVEVS